MSGFTDWLLADPTTNPEGGAQSVQPQNAQPLPIDYGTNSPTPATVQTGADANRTGEMQWGTDGWQEKKTKPLAQTAAEVKAARDSFLTPDQQQYKEEAKGLLGDKPLIGAALIALSGAMRRPELGQNTSTLFADGLDRAVKFYYDEKGKESKEGDTAYTKALREQNATSLTRIAADLSLGNTREQNSETKLRTQEELLKQRKAEAAQRLALQWFNAQNAAKKTQILGDRLALDQGGGTPGAYLDKITQAYINEYSLDPDLAIIRAAKRDEGTNAVQAVAGQGGDATDKKIALQTVFSNSAYTALQRATQQAVADKLLTATTVNDAKSPLDGSVLYDAPELSEDAKSRLFAAEDNPVAFRRALLEYRQARDALNKVYQSPGAGGLTPLQYKQALQDPVAWLQSQTKNK